MSNRRIRQHNRPSPRKTNSHPYQRKEAKVNVKSNAEEPQTDFGFLGFKEQDFNYKSNNPLGKTSSGSASDSVFKRGKQSSQSPPPAGGAAADDEEMPDIRLPLFLPFALGKQQNSGNDASDDYCTEIVDQMRQNTNSLIDEIKESRKSSKESTDSANKQLIDAIKELQSTVTKALIEELPKALKK